MDQGHIDAPAIMRRRRKVARQQREKTPEPFAKVSGNGERRLSDEESSSTADQNQNIQTVRMQIRPPGSISAHKSKILSRRNKSFAGAAARSLSAPRKIDDSEHSNPEVIDLLRYARRSLSSPRHKEESSESGSRSSPPQTPTKIIPPPVPLRTQFPEGYNKQQQQQKQKPLDNDDRISRLERNLKRFEEERRKFELDKKKLEREKREIHKMRYKHLDSDERRRMLENYKKINDWLHLPIEDSDENRRKVQSFREPSRKPLIDTLEKKKPKPKPNDDDIQQLHQKIRRYSGYESSTASSEEDSEAVQADVDDEEIIKQPVVPSSFERRSPTNNSRHSSSISPRRRPTTTASNVSLQEQLNQKTTNGEMFSSQLTKTSIFEPSSPPPSSMMEKKGFLSKIFSIFKKNEKPKTEILLPKDDQQLIPKIPSEVINDDRIFTKSFLKLMFYEFREEWRKLKADYPEQMHKMHKEWNRCLSHVILLGLFIGFGGLLFRFIEGTFENTYKCQIRKVKRDFIDQLWITSHNMREDDWKSAARTKLRTFEEELQTSFEAGLLSYSGKNAWNFINSVLYCLTVATTIGYGHIAPKTNLGRSVTMVYAIFGVPIFLILLADFGKLFTRGIKFVWSYVRRLYYTGTCRKVRKQQQIRDVMRGFNAAYDAAIRRPSMYFKGTDIESGKISDERIAAGGAIGGTRSPTNLGSDPMTPQSQSTHYTTASNIETPTTPYPETIEINDEFNLPISLAITILLLYIVAGSSIYVLWEDWTYFESIYFVFISMSTIGFGDFVPNHPIFMMCSILYLIFGLALTSMCINVVQLKLHDSFRLASAKLGATMGIGFSDEEDEDDDDDDGQGGGKSQNITPTEMASVQSVNKLENILEHDRENHDNSRNIGDTRLPPNSNKTKQSKSNNLTFDTKSNHDRKDDRTTPPPPPLLPRQPAINQPIEIEISDKKKKKKLFNF